MPYHSYSYNMCASTMTSQGVLPFVPEGVWLSGKIVSDPFVGQICAPGRAAAGSRARGSNTFPPRAEATTPPASHVTQFPAMPRLQEVLPLDPPRGLHSPLDELILWLNDTTAMHSGAYPQDAIGFKSSPTLPRSKVRAAVRYCAGHDEDDVPTIPAVDFRYQECNSNKFQYFISYQDNTGLKCPQAVCGSQGGSTVQPLADSDVLHLDHYCGQVSTKLKRSPTMHLLAEKEGDMKQRRINRARYIIAKPQGLARLAKKLSMMLSLAMP